jgi:hypothetical protein
VPFWSMFAGRKQVKVSLAGRWFEQEISVRSPRGESLSCHWACIHTPGFEEMNRSPEYCRDSVGIVDFDVCPEDRALL